ncbi:hypothetical protein VULLAG_LOCUS5244 [Vulpes lagopus]
MPVGCRNLGWEVLGAGRPRALFRGRLGTAAWASTSPQPVFLACVAEDEEAPGTEKPGDEPKAARPHAAGWAQPD